MQFDFQLKDPDSIQNMGKYNLPTQYPQKTKKNKPSANY